MSERVTWDDMPGLLDELKAIARQLLRFEPRRGEWQSTALVLSGFRRQVPAGGRFDEVTWKDKRYFFAAMHRAMRRALIDHARSRASEGRRLPMSRIEDVQIADLPQQAHDQPEMIAALLETLESLEALHPEWAEVVQCRYLSGMTVEEAASLMRLSEKTVRRHWAQAKVWLHRETLRALSSFSEGGEG